MHDIEKFSQNRENPTELYRAWQKSVLF